MRKSLSKAHTTILRRRRARLCTGSPKSSSPLPTEHAIIAYTTSHNLRTVDSQRLLTAVLRLISPQHLTSETRHAPRDLLSLPILFGPLWASCSHTIPSSVSRPLYYIISLYFPVPLTVLICLLTILPPRLRYLLHLVIYMPARSSLHLVHDLYLLLSYLISLYYLLIRFIYILIRYTIYR